MMFDKKEYMKKWSKNYYIKNKEKHKKQMQEWRKNNPEKIKEDSKLWYQNNIEKIKKYDKQYYQEHKEERRNYRKTWKKNNSDYYNRYDANRRKTNLKVNLCHKIATAIGISLNGNKNGRHWEDLVGYTLDDLIKRLKFTMPKGYSWQNFLNGKLHIDHIIPIRAFIFNEPKDKEFKQCWSLWNLRLLTKEQNLRKNSNFDDLILLGLSLKEMI